LRIAELTKNPQNPRIIKDEKFTRLKKSLQEFPQMMTLRPIVIDDQGVVLGGNMRLEALKALGHKEIPDEWVKRASELTEEQKREFIIKDNSAFGEYNWDVLANEWSDYPLTDWGVDLPEDWTRPAPVEEDESAVAEMVDRAAELQKKWATESGQLWEIGRHRLLCGDSTQKADVGRVCADNKPLLMVTDPPYGVEYDPHWRDEIVGEFGQRAARGNAATNDDLLDWSAAFTLFDGNAAYVWHAGKFAAEVAVQLNNCGFQIRNQIVWAKQHFAISRGNYHWQHEPCWYAVRKGRRSEWKGDRTQSTLWEISSLNPAGRKEERQAHGTQKPLECMARPIRNHEGDVYDPFVGSGTTIVAAEQNNRTCYAMEISPAYVAVCLERLSALGLTSKLVENG
jgi:DNA modification methylase